MAGQALPSANAYTVSSSVLLIKVSYLAGLNLSKGDTAKFDVTFDTGAVVTLTVNVANSYTPSGSSSGSSDSSTIIKMATADGVTTEFAKFTGSTGTDKTATASVTERQIADAITAATEAAAKQGTKAAVEISVATGASAIGVTATIPRTSVQAAANSGIEELKISSSVVSVAFDGTALDAISANATGDITVKATQTGSTMLSESDKAIIGTRPVYALSLSSDGAAISDFGGGENDFCFSSSHGRLSTKEGAVKTAPSLVYIGVLSQAYL